MSYLDRLARQIESAPSIGARKRGIHARTYLPLPQYDDLFEVREIGGRMLCVMKPGPHDYDKHYWEEVPV